jgi:hypothetical protein
MTFQDWAMREDGRVPLDNLSPHDRFNCFSIVSIMAHEIRHYHDFLISPHSARIFRLRILILLNVLQIIPSFLRSGGNCVPVPITEWCELEDEARLAFISRLKKRPDGKPWKPISLPHFSVKSTTSFKDNYTQIEEKDGLIENLIIAAAKHLDSIRALSRSHASTLSEDFQPADVYELSALLVQTQEVAKVYGESEAVEFLNHIIGRGRNRYSNVLQAIGTLTYCKRPDRSGKIKDASSTY